MIYLWPEFAQWLSNQMFDEYHWFLSWQFIVGISSIRLKIGLFHLLVTDCFTCHVVIVDRYKCLRRDSLRVCNEFPLLSYILWTQQKSHLKSCSTFQCWESKSGQHPSRHPSRHRSSMMAFTKLSVSLHDELPDTWLSWASYLNRRRWWWWGFSYQFLIPIQL